MPFICCPNVCGIASHFFFTPRQRLTLVAIRARFDRRADHLRYGYWRIVPSIGAIVRLPFLVRRRHLPWFMDIWERRRILLAAL